jgi:hypothetical protein
MWEDIVISVMGFLFGFMLFPQVRDSLNGKCMNLYTSGLTTLGIFCIDIAFASLGLWISVISETFVGLVWLLLFVLGVKYRK